MTQFANKKVAVLGAAGGIGQPLSLMLARSAKVDQLRLYDIVGTPGVAADLSHIPQRGFVNGFVGPDQLGAALRDVDVVVIPAGVPRKPGMSRDDLFNTNASIVQTLARAIGEFAPNASILVIANPVNSTVPIVAEQLKKQGVYRPENLYGVTTLDVHRARRFYGEVARVSPARVSMPVVGGHAGTTIVPLLSQVQVSGPHDFQLSGEQRDELTRRIQFGGDEVVKAKDGAGSATLSMAVAGAEMTLNVIDGLRGESIIECAFVQSTLTDAPFFASPVHIDARGNAERRVLPAMSDYEQTLVDAAVPDLIASAEKGIEFVRNNQ